MKRNILEIHQDDLVKILLDNGHKKFRAKQIYDFIYRNKKLSFIEMHTLPKSLIGFLNDNFTFITSKIEEHLVSTDKDTEKILLKLKDDNFVEAVILNQKGRTTICISSQVGCSLRCKFCATGQMRFKRNLEVHEIVEEVLLLRSQKDIDNIVFMGMGEPFLNYTNVMKAINILVDKSTLDFSPRRITISTAGIPHKIKRLAKENKNIRLSVSLNALSNERRDELMNVNRKYPLEKLTEALLFYQQHTNKRFTFEYVMIKGLNMRSKDAERIKILSEKLNFKLNLIPYNPVKGNNFVKPDKDDIEKFMGYFTNTNIPIVRRYTRGREIQAACGQLAAKK